ncbi:glycosyltransferase [Actinokineospora spheciospongiae]|uniref:glycosyltransferase n=1 Tax=Actinokineospora spheciospongiae TaxID=909613 RepID=UPI000D7105CC|nr:glycosyltransferase [Actinokineospora spheciospongiae]PWW66855.1 putative glycosyltransferase [Actinokineospora spheciospongiae]
MIAYYVHHHGSGHRHRAVSIARRLRTPVVGLSSAPEPDGWPGEWVRLPDDADGVDTATADVTAHGTLHWVPLGHQGLRARMAAVSAVLARPDVRALVSDVSVEIALLARLHGVAVVVMAQPGDRLDPAHRLAYDAAERLLAPWPARPQPGWPASWTAKAVHLGAVSRFDDRTAPDPPGPGRVLALWGTGGTEVGAAEVIAAAEATPGWEWEVAGPPSAEPGPGNLRWRGWLADPWPALGAAGVVVTHAGQNALAEVAAARRPAVVIPQPRPFGEQRATAAALSRGRLAVVVPAWPAAERWPGLLDRAVRRGGDRWSHWSRGDGAARAAALLDELGGSAR